MLYNYAQFIYCALLKYFLITHLPQNNKHPYSNIEIKQYPVRGGIKAYS